MTKTSEKYDYNSTFPSTLRVLMEERKVTQQKIAEICSVKPQSVSQWRNGETRPDILSLAKIANHFGVSTDYLLGLTDVKTTDIATKELCSTLGLSETVIDILTKGTRSIGAFEKEMGQKMTSNEICMLTTAHKNILTNVFNSLAEDLGAIQDSPSLAVLIDRLHKLSLNDGGGKTSFVNLNTRETRVFSDRDVNMIAYNNGLGGDFVYAASLKEMLIDATITEIIAKLRDIKREALADDREGDTQ